MADLACYWLSNAYHLGGASFVAITAAQQGGRLGGIYLLASFASPYGILMSLQAVNAAGYTKKTVTSSGLFIGYCLGM